MFYICGYAVDLPSQTLHKKVHFSVLHMHLKIFLSYYNFIYDINFSNFVMKFSFFKTSLLMHTKNKCGYFNLSPCKLFAMICLACNIHSTAKCSYTDFSSILNHYLIQSVIQIIFLYACLFVNSIRHQVNNPKESLAEPLFMCMCGKPVTSLFVCRLMAIIKSNKKSSLDSLVADP